MDDEEFFDFVLFLALMLCFQVFEKYFLRSFRVNPYLLGRAEGGRYANDVRIFVVISIVILI